MSDVEQAVKEKYGAIAAAVSAASTPAKVGCCGPTACGSGDPITSNLYSEAEANALPAEAVSASLGCGNPTALSSPSKLARPSLTSDPAAASTSCCQPAGWDRPAGSTAST